MNKTARRPRKRRSRARWVWLGLAAVALVVAGVGYVELRASRVQEGAAAPPFVLQAGGGGHVDIASYLGRRPVILMFDMSYR